MTTEDCRSKNSHFHTKFQRKIKGIAHVGSKIRNQHKIFKSKSFRG